MVKRVFKEGVRGNKEGHYPIWIVEHWNPWKYYLDALIDSYMHWLAKLPFASFLVDAIWETRYYPLFRPETTKYVTVEWDDIDEERWGWANESSSS